MSLRVIVVSKRTSYARFVEEERDPRAKALLRRRDPSVRPNDKIIVRTSRRGTFTIRSKASGPAASKSVSVRAPIKAGSTVAARTRRFSMAREYSNPDTRSAFAFSSHVR